MSQISDLYPSLDQFLQEDFEEETFTKVIIKNLEVDEWISFKEFLENLQVNTPEDFYQQLGEDSTLFIYSQATGKRLGFIIKLNEDSDLERILELWEATMESDFENLFLLLGKEGPALVPDFRDANYKGVVFRYQTFSEEDLGICYTISEGFFVITSSYESMTKVIDKLNE